MVSRKSILYIVALVVIALTITLIVLFEHRPNPPAVKLVPAIPAVKIHRIFAIGDSLTFAGKYEAHLGTLLGPEWKVINRGIPSETTSDILVRFEHDVITPKNAEYVIVFAGINDVAHDVCAEGIEANLLQMYRAARRRGGARVIAVTMTPFNLNTGAQFGDPRGWWTTRRQSTLEKVNAWILSSADADVHVDAYSALEDKANRQVLQRTYAAKDWLHLSDAGYARLGDAIYNALRPSRQRISRR